MVRSQQPEWLTPPELGAIRSPVHQVPPMSALINYSTLPRYARSPSPGGERFALPPDAVFNLPLTITATTASKGILVCAPALARWCVLHSDEELRVLNQFASRQCLRDIACGQLSQDAVLRVVAEIIEKGFFADTPVADFDGHRAITCHITEACNLRCTHCYRFSGRALPREMDALTWRRLAEEHAASGGRFATITGGEPLLRRKVVEAILQVCAERDLLATLLTNGVFVRSRDAIASIAGSLAAVQVSMDGTSPAVNDRVRGDGVFEGAWRAVEILCSFEHLRVFVAMTPLPETLDAIEAEIGEFHDLVRSRFGNRVVIRLSANLLEGRTIKALSADGHRQRVRRLQKLVQGEDWDQRIDAASFEPGIRRHTCGFAGGGICIEPDGVVLACEFDRESEVANVQHEPLHAIKRRLADLARRSGVNDSPICAPCDVRYLCGGSCRIRPNGHEIRKPVSLTMGHRVVVQGEHGSGCNGELRAELIDRIIAANGVRYSWQANLCGA